MPILGINENCIKCLECVKSCPSLLFRDDDATGKVIFEKTVGYCIECGHCIAICPEDAIEYENMRDDPFSFEGLANIGSIVPYDSLYKLLRSKRSIRRYKTEPVESGLLKKVFEVMRYAPSGANTRDWKFRLVSDQELLKKLSSGIQDAFMENEALKNSYALVFAEEEKRGMADPIFRGAPHVIFVSSTMKSDMAALNAGIVLTYGMLAAESLGLATCWIGFTSMGFALNKDLLKLAKIRGNFYGAVSIGYPAVKYLRCPPRPPLKVKGDVPM
ncbi:MAG: nitroreductase family protein [Promethearchaeota archaeon]